MTSEVLAIIHDDVIKWKHFPRYWPFVRGIHRSPVNSLHKGQWRGALMFSLICAWINGWVNNREAGDLRYYCAHYDVILMSSCRSIMSPIWLSTNADLFWTGSSRILVREILFAIKTFSFNKIRLKLSCTKCHLIYCEFNVLTHTYLFQTSTCL